jgi:hypothetical protein
MARAKSAFPDSSRSARAREACTGPFAVDEKLNGIFTVARYISHLQSFGVEVTGGHLKVADVNRISACTWFDVSHALGVEFERHQLQELAVEGLHDCLGHIEIDV